MKKLLPLLLMSFLVLSIACKKEKEEKDSTLRHDSPVLLELNFKSGWVDNISSSLLLSDGTIIHYDKAPQEMSFWIDQDVLSEEEINQNISLADSLVTTANESDVEEIHSLVQAVENELTDTSYFCIDAGLNTIYAFKWSEENESYERILLKQCGDQIINNNHSKATEILEKLSANSVNWELSGGCCIE